MNDSQREDYLWLMSEEAKPILTQTQAAFADRINAVRIAKSLRRKTTPTRSALVMEQAQLRERASEKFSKASQMFFTRRGLEQASGSGIAQYKARRFATLDRVADVCCGVGGDLIALANRTQAAGTAIVGVDSDELTCLFAERNLRLNTVSVEHVGGIGDALATQSVLGVSHAAFAEFDLADFDGIHIDPDRRVGERTVRGNRFSPSLTEVLGSTVGKSLAIKVAPATPPIAELPLTVQREWIGDHRECKQQVLWLGPIAAQPGHRTATYVGRKGRVSQISVPAAEAVVPRSSVNEIGRYVFEPHAAVLAAGLEDALAQQFDIAKFTSSIAYLTGDTPIRDPLLANFEVIEVLKLQLRNTVAALRALDVGEVEIKKRGIENVTVDTFRRMKLEGSGTATVILTRYGKTRIAIIARRVR